MRSSILAMIRNVGDEIYIPANMMISVYTIVVEMLQCLSNSSISATHKPGKV